MTNHHKLGRILVVAALVSVGIGNLASVATASSVAQRWAKRYDGRGDGRSQARAVAVSPDGSRLFVTGSRGNGSMYETVAYDAATGAKLWAGRFGEPRWYSHPVAIAVSPDGSKVFVTGNVATSHSATLAYVTIAYNASTGASLWVQRFDGTSSAEDLAIDLGVSVDGTMLFVTGSSSSSANRSDEFYATLAYDTRTGARLWISRYRGGDGKSLEFPSGLAVDPDGSEVIVTGESGRSLGYRYATVAYDTSTGRKLWVRRYDGPGAGPTGTPAFAEDIGFAPDGSAVYVTGSVLFGNTTSYDFETLAYDASTGKRVWVRRFDGVDSGVDQAISLAVSPTGAAVFVSGITSSSVVPSVGGDYVTIAYDAHTGTQEWMSSYQSVAGANKTTGAAAMGVSPDGAAVYVTGSRDLSFGRLDYATVAYDASTGAQLWVRTFGRKYRDQATDLAVSPDGTSVFVTGFVTTDDRGLDLDYATVAYTVG